MVDCTKFFSEEVKRRTDDSPEYGLHILVLTDLDLQSVYCARVIEQMERLEVPHGQWEEKYKTHWKSQGFSYLQSMLNSINQSITRNIGKLVSNQSINQSINQWLLYP